MTFHFKNLLLNIEISYPLGFYVYFLKCKNLHGVSINNIRAIPSVIVTGDRY